VQKVQELLLRLRRCLLGGAAAAAAVAIAIAAIAGGYVQARPAHDDMLWTRELRPAALPTALQVLRSLDGAGLQLAANGSVQGC
jgi:hypothetical protein